MELCQGNVKFFPNLLAEEYFKYTSCRKIRSSIYSIIIIIIIIIIIMDNLSPRDNIILLLTRAQPCFPHYRYNSTDSTAVT